MVTTRASAAQSAEEPMPENADQSDVPDHGYATAESQLEHEPTPIETARYSPKTKSKGDEILIFSHGAGGDMKSPAVTNLRDGLATSMELVTFNSSMSLPARIKQFATLIASERDQGKSDANIILGGRSLGARSAVIAATESEGRFKTVVCVSYPLHTEKHGSLEFRDQILLDMPEDCEVLFISGSRDTMCNQDRMAEVRRKMKAKSWMVVVEGANHTMEMKPSVATVAVGKCTGEVAAKWIRGEGRGARESAISWDGEHGVAEWHQLEKHHESDQGAHGLKGKILGLLHHRK